MKKLAILLIAAVVWMGADFAADSSGVAEAQVPYVTYYRPATVFYAPAPVRRVAYAPTCCASPPAVVYQPAVYQPAARVVRRYRPILGGTVTRVRYGYAPVFLAP